MANALAPSTAVSQPATLLSLYAEELPIQDLPVGVLAAKSTYSTLATLSTLSCPKASASTISSASTWAPEERK